MSTQSPGNMNPDLDNWDPMLEDFTLGRKYEEGPGADLISTSGSNQNEEASKIFLKNVPQNMTADGIKNLCLSAGIPTSVNIFQGFAEVTFKSVGEAELAIRDLNNTPPYFLKAKFARQNQNAKDLKNNETPEEVKPDERWITDPFYICPPTDKHYLSKKYAGKNITNVSPYFSICCEHINPSLHMRQKNLDFKTKKECVSMGRGYINMGDLDSFKYENRIFSVQSNNWNDSDCETTCCDNCGSETIRKYKEENYCSNLCETEAESISDNNIPKTSVFNFFTPGASGTLYYLKENRDGLVNCCVVLEKESDIYKELLERIGNVGERISGKKGDRVKVRNANGQWLRGVISSNEGDFYKVSLIDYGETISVENVYRLPRELEEIPSFGGIGRFSVGEIPDFAPVKFRVKEKKVLGSWLCDVMNDNGDVLSEVLLEEWSIPGCLTSVPLESGCSVVLTTFKDMKTVFVRRIDGSWDEDFVRLSNDVAAYSLDGKTYEKLPKLGEVCSARYKEDGCFYRAVVRSFRRNSVCVMFMDYGNEQDTDLDDLRYLPNAIRQINCFAARVRLKNVPRKSSPESVNYMNQLTAYGRELRLTCDNGEVVLTVEMSGDVVNDVICNLVMPIWEKDAYVFIKSGEAYFLDSIAELRFQLDKIEDVFVMNVDVTEFSTSGTFWATRNRSDYLAHLNGELKQAITEYCSFLADDPYLPRKGELCLVEFEGDWYRGVSLDDRVSPYKVFLIDFGILISVEAKQMRKILRELLETPMLALECRIPDFKNFDEGKQEKITEWIMKMNKKVLKDVKILQEVDGVYLVSIPFVQALLES